MIWRHYDDCSDHSVRYTSKAGVAIPVTFELLRKPLQCCEMQSEPFGFKPCIFQIKQRSFDVAEKPGHIETACAERPGIEGIYMKISPLSVGPRAQP
ncbi:hypothetical protein [Methylomonas rosea]|uniref:Uncharacterized protein n=1 Tax=Methylomonas rosea TaxID=2952227 RepID=A0ABT1TPE2_9GAMM|nr:hypothetical protein [Methylomonas sp. WSC-7]MCQ8116415.1 hypothetical protein [Methylomonas sp. WSC-7]